MNSQIAASVEPALARLRRGEPVYGIMQTLPLVHITEAAVGAGFDFVMLDCEHGIVDDRVHAAALNVIAPTAAFSAVRVGPRDLAAVRRYLAWGVDAILMPDVRTCKAAAEFAACDPQSTALLFAMIESADGVALASRIAATPGLAGLVIGLHDLAADLGTPHDFTQPAFARAVAQVERAADEAQVLLGSGMYPGFPLERLLEARHSLILAGSDVAALGQGFRAQHDATRA